VSASALPLIDTHCHLDFEAFDADRDAVLARASAAGVDRIVVPGVEPSQWDSLGAFSERHPQVSVAVGIHPQMLASLPAADVDRGLSRLGSAAKASGAVAIGECGLDGPTADRGASYELQARVLESHLAVARDLALPVILHIYRAHGRALELLKAWGPLSAGGIVHSYSGSVDLVKRYLDLNLFISFAGAVTRLNAKRPKAAALAVPLERLLLETDAPEQSPEGANSSRNEPAHLVHTLRSVASLHGLPEKQLAVTTTANARRIYGF